MFFVFLLFTFGCAAGYIGFREYLDEGSTGLWGHPAGIGVVLGVMGVLLVPASGYLMTDVAPLMGPWFVALLCVPFAPYFAMFVGRLVSMAFTIEGSQPAERPNPFRYVEQSVRIGATEPALDEYRRILREDAESLEPAEILVGHTRVVELLVRKDEHAEALQWIDKAHAAERAAPPPKRPHDPPALTPADEIRLGLLRSEALVGLSRRDEAVEVLRELLGKQQDLPDTDLGRAAAEMIPMVAGRLKAIIEGVEEKSDPIENVDIEQPDLPVPERHDEEIVIEPPPDLNI